MKTNRAAITIVIILLLIAGWGGLILSGTSTKENKKKFVSSADEYMQKKLYQKAIMDYEETLKIEESKEVRNKLLEAYRLSFEDGTSSRKEYVAALETACKLYENDPYYWETILEFLVEQNMYDDANVYRKQCLRTEADSEKLRELNIEIKYHFKHNKRTYDAIYRTPQGYYTVCKDDKWGVIAPDGEVYVELYYQYIGPWNQKNVGVYKNEKGTRLIDSEKVVQAIYGVDGEKTGPSDESTIPVFSEDGWKFIDYDGKKVLGSYEDASGFYDGIAAVKSSGEWSLIAKDGKAILENKFEDIKMYGNGDYTFENVMIAKQEGSYSIYNRKGKKQSEFTADDMDIYLGSMIAYKAPDGKWGFIDKEGTQVIEPSYDEAKSFSNGLAAVKKGDKWGFINTSGTLVIDYQFDLADYFTEDGICFVSELIGQYTTIELQFK